MMTQRSIQNCKISNNGNGTLMMKQSQVNEAMEQLGVTKEMREKYRNAEQQLLADAVKVAGNELCENPDIGKAQVIMGRGDGRKTVSVTGRKEVSYPDPQIGETNQRTEYGRVKISEKRQLSSDFREQILSEVAKDCEEVFSKR